MNIEETKVLLKAIKEKYPKQFAGLDKQKANDLITSWNSELKDYDFTKVKEVVSKYFKSYTVAPKVWQISKELKRKTMSNHPEREYSEEEMDDLYITYDEMVELTRDVKLPYILNGKRFETFEEMFQAAKMEVDYEKQ